MGVGAPIGNKNAVGHGRPKIYDADALGEQLHDYVDDTVDPRIEEFCLPRNMPSTATLYELGKNNDCLSSAIIRAKMKRNLYLTGEGCGLHPKVIGIRLSTDQGMTEKIQQEISGSGGSDFIIKIKRKDDAE